MGQGEGSQDWAADEGIEEEDGGQCGSQDLAKGEGVDEENVVGWWCADLWSP